MTRSQLSVLAFVFVVSAPAAARAQADLTGDWTVSVESPQGPATIDATMKQTGEDVIGTITSPMGSVEFKGKVVKDALNVVYSLDLQGNTIEITMTGTIAGDNITGKLSIGGLGDVPWSARRKLADAGGAAAPPSTAAAPAPYSAPAAAAGDLSGRWDITFNVGGNPMPATAALAQAGDQITGTISNQAGETAITGAVTGSAVRLDFSVETPQGPIAVTLTGEIGAAGIAGKASIVGLGETDWVATRAR